MVDLDDVEWMIRSNVSWSRLQPTKMLTVRLPPSGNFFWRKEAWDTLCDTEIRGWGKVLLRATRTDFVDDWSKIRLLLSAPKFAQSFCNDALHTLTEPWLSLRTCPAQEGGHSSLFTITRQVVVNLAARQLQFTGGAVDGKVFWLRASQDLVQFGRYPDSLRPGFIRWTILP
ncbi:hypothetical protein U879_07890 [Defluviimonas sp. 20V17]|nr:hypothetical protein U879_07890 [Defluviimonas sp. 20V17]